MTTSKNHDHVLPGERVSDYSVTGWQRARRWTIAALSILALFTINDNVRLRDELVIEREGRAHEVARLRGKLAALTPPAPSCNRYPVHMERSQVEHCVKVSAR